MKLNGNKFQNTHEPISKNIQLDCFSSIKQEERNSVDMLEKQHNQLRNARARMKCIGESMKWVVFVRN